MKTEEQVTTKMDEVIAGMEKLPGVLGTEEDRQQAVCLLGQLTAVCWVLGCEDLLRPIINNARIEALAEKFKGV